MVDVFNVFKCAVCVLCNQKNSSTGRTHLGEWVWFFNMFGEYIAFDCCSLFVWFVLNGLRY